MTGLQLFVAIVSSATALAYSCRLGSMGSAHHGFAVLAGHYSLGCLAIWSATSAWQSPPSGAVLIACAMSTLWVIVTYPAHGSPAMARDSR